MAPASDNKTVILFLSHYISETLLTEFAKLAVEVEGVAELVYALDASASPPAMAPPQLAGRLFTFTQTELRSLGYARGRRGGVQFGTADLPLLLYYRRHSNYQYYWVVEYDVRFSGSWRVLLGAFSANDADLLCTTLTRHAKVPRWYHWRSLRPPSGALRKQEMIRGFMPIYRISGRALAEVHAAYSAGWMGHYECTLPTLILRNALRIEDIGGDGEFVRDENRGRFYSNTPGQSSLAPGTFVFRPVMTEPGPGSNLLWHPIKPVGETPWDVANRMAWRRRVLKRLAILLLLGSLALFGLCGVPPFG